MIKVAGTGHRPNKLWGYDISQPKYKELLNLIKEQLKLCKADYVISGMALGFDTILALAVLELKAEGLNIKLEAALPCSNQDALWPAESKKQYSSILSRADIVTHVSFGSFTPHCMGLRNIYMIDNADIILAYWDGSTGGTSHAVNQAKRKRKLIINLYNQV